MVCVGTAWGRGEDGRCCTLIKIIPAMSADLSDEESESFGQTRPPLYLIIKDILRDYPSGQVFKVMIDDRFHFFFVFVRIARFSTSVPVVCIT